ncbi:hypothetical protein ACJMK2_034192 [Sinanodonta woodiana]|uniref:Programmed cell death protein 2 C-terminal domain-containing protein n=1 Tax=Sinanodonta woodiana TaxID=1069815 RepID=A0ABD3WS47_SINWO
MPTLLGLIDENIKDGRKINWCTNIVGGDPVWTDSSSRITIPSCTQCRGSMALIVQLYCPLDQSFYHRVLYIFACTSPQCWNKPYSWLVYRAQVLDVSSVKQKTETKNQSTSSKGDWGIDMNDWGEEEEVVLQETGFDDSSVQELKFSSKDIISEKSDSPINEDNEEIGIDFPSNELNLHSENLDDAEDYVATESTVEPEDISLPDPEETIKLLKDLHVSPKGVTERSSGTSLVGYYLNVIEEPVSEHDWEQKHVTKLLKEYEQRERKMVQEFEDDSTCMDVKGTSVEKYEKTAVAHGDVFFHKFRNKISPCPQQCVRYNWNGAPVYINKPSPLSAEQMRCSECGSVRVFELQLMPALVPYLCLPQSSDPAVEFGTVLIYTCKASCWKDGDTVKSELALVQSDPDQQFFK